MKTYFVTSDLHSYITPLEEALTEVGFEYDNPDHILIVCGDIFDRGFDTLEVYKLLSTLAVERLILIRGNHERLYLELLEKDLPESHDYSNGTVRTFCTIADASEETVTSYFYFSAGIRDSAQITKQITAAWKKIKNKVGKSLITQFIKSSRWLNYYELGNYIFVHSFIPLRLKKCSETKWMHNWPLSRIPEKLLEPLPYWRTKSADYQWDDASWGCPYKLFKAGLFDKELNKNKILVCGHWHTSAFHLAFEEDPRLEDYSIYRGKNLIALDACTAKTKKTNVLVLTENEVYKAT